MINKDGQTADVTIALPARVTWSMPVLDRVDDIMETFMDVGVGVTSIAMVKDILIASIIADRNTACVHLTRIG